MEKERKEELSNEELCILAQGGDDPAPKSAIFNCVATEISVLPRTETVRTGLGASNLNKQKTTRIPEWKTGGLCQSGYQVALLARLQLMLQNLLVRHCFVEVSSNYDIVFWAQGRQFLLAKNNANGSSSTHTASGY